MTVTKKENQATTKGPETSSKVNCDQLEDYESVHFKSEDEESLELKISPDGLLMIKSVDINNNMALESITISGFTPEQAKAKSKGFWSNLWRKVKKAVGDLIDAITFPVGPATCRPTASVGTHRGRITSVFVGINCFN